MSYYFTPDAGQMYGYPQTPSTPRSAVSPITPQVNAYGQYYLMNPTALGTYPNYYPAPSNVYNHYNVTPTPTVPHHSALTHRAQTPTVATQPKRKHKTVATKSPTPNPAKVVLILILDHGKEWADRPHQDLIAQLRDNGYHPVASSPASAYLSITRYNPSIILVMEATTLNRTCDRDRIASRLRDFTYAGGILIFGGVPRAFNPPNDPTANTVFINAFHINWIVGNHLEMKIGDTSGRMQPAKLTLTGTFLNNVALRSRLYRPYTQRIKNDEPCAVALQPYGDGAMGFIGAEDLFGEDARWILMGMCAIAGGMTRTKGGKGPAEVLLGGKVWEPMGWKD